MKPILKVFSALLGLMLVLLLASFVLDFFLVREATPPTSVIDIKTFFAWKPNPSGAVRVNVGNTVYYQLLGPAGRTLASGQSAYAFDSTGKFIGWTKDAGDFYQPRVVYSPGAERTQITVEMVRELMATNTSLNTNSQPTP